MSLSVGTLMAALWSRYNAGVAAQDPKMLEIVEELGGVTPFIKSVGDAADVVNDLFDEFVNFNWFIYDWNIEHMDVNGVREDTLDAAVWEAICGKQDVFEATKRWMNQFIPHAQWE